jgi:hypothetical protein
MIFSNKENFFSLYNTSGWYNPFDTASLPIPNVKGG